jgi:hypothetical protein
LSEAAPDGLRLEYATMTTLDGESLFDEQKLVIEVGSPTRQYIEQSMPGLDGVLSIDLGSRARRIRQKGILRAMSRQQLDQRMAAVSALIDGQTHELVTNAGDQISNLRMDSFEAGSIRYTGGSVEVGYEIVYTQLVMDS